MNKNLFKIFFIMILIIGGFNLAEAEEIEVDGGIHNYSNKNAPKKIISQNIKKFSLIIEDDAAEDHFISGRCTMKIENTPEGLKMTFLSGKNPELNKSKIINEKILKELQKLIIENDVASINGHNKWNSALGNFLDLEIVYESGEVISAYGEGGEAVIPDNFNPKIFVKFFCDKLKIKT